MDYTTREVELVKEAALHADRTVELNELQLSLVGGGIGDTII